MTLVDAMEQPKVNEYALHRMDLNSSGPVNTSQDTQASTEDLRSYAASVIEDLLSSGRACPFIFPNMNELVPAALKAICEGADWSEKSHEIAQKLFDVETQTQERIKQLGTKIKKGGLLQLKLSQEGRTQFVITKIDDGEFFDEFELKLKSGLPKSKNRLQKAAIITFEGNNSVSELIVSDSNTKITEYWYQYFLVAKQQTDSETNTKTAFNEIDRLLNKEVKSQSSIDYWYLRNEVVSYFRNEPSMAYDELVNRIKKHKPESKVFADRFDKFIEKLERLPNSSKKPFDTQFDITTSAIKARISRKVTLDDNFELRINGEIEDLESKIVPEEDQKGKYIKIYSDTGYYEFSSHKKENEPD